VVALALAVPACTGTFSGAETAPVVPAAPLAVNATQDPAPVAAPSARGVAWSASAQPQQVPEFQGTPLSLPPGARCATFRNLPSTTYSTNTLVKDACLRIPDGTTIEVRAGTTLVIVATTELYVGKNVVFDAKGSRGNRGERARFASISHAAASEVEIRELCVEHGNRCACPSDAASLSSIQGHAGADGTAGGVIRLIAGALVSPSRLTGFAIDVSGGFGGPPGDSGSQECSRGELRCSSAACAGGVLAGANGPRGGVFLAVGGALPGATVERLKASVGRADSDGSVALGSEANVSAHVAEVDTEAIQKGWQRHAGEVAY